jgi:hypothetical protein
MIGVIQSIRERLEISERKGWDDIDINDSEEHKSFINNKLQLISFLRNLEYQLMRVKLQANH